MTTTELRQPVLSGQCAHLGIKDDARTCLAFPSTWNYCHQSAPPASVRLAHQRQFCQSDEHTQCPVFRRELRGPLPPEIRGRHAAAGHGRSRAAIPVLVVTLPLALILMWLAGNRGYLGSTIQQALGGEKAVSAVDPTQPSLPPSPPPPSTVVLFPLLGTLTTADSSIGSFWTTPTYLGGVSTTPTPISTAPGTCGHELETPFGPDKKLLIHKVGGGDSLNRYEILYRTSVAAMLAVNLPFPIPLRPERYLVIPLDSTEVGDLPIFEPILVSYRNTPIQTMAFKVSSDLQAFERYNGFDESCRDFIGWVLAPRETPTP